VEGRRSRDPGALHFLEDREISRTALHDCLFIHPVRAAWGFRLKNLSSRTGRRRRNSTRGSGSVKLLTLGERVAQHPVLRGYEVDYITVTWCRAVDRIRRKRCVVGPRRRIESGYQTAVEAVEAVTPVLPYGLTQLGSQRRHIELLMGHGVKVARTRPGPVAMSDRLDRYSRHGLTCGSTWGLNMILAYRGDQRGELRWRARTRTDPAMEFTLT